MTKDDRMNRREEHAILSLPPSVTAGTAERELHTLKGINEISINHLAHTIRVTYDPTKITSDKIRASLKSLG